jgi:ketosteroid isomerase-like protein
MKRSGFSRCALAGFAIAALAGCSPGSPPGSPGTATSADPGKVVAEVKAAIKTQVDAYAARDAATAASIAAPDMLGMFHGEPNVIGQQATLDQIKEQMADPALKLSVSDESVDVAASGDLAVYRATYHFTFTDPTTKRPATELGNWVAVFTRQANGTMKMSKDMVLDMPAPANGTP